MSDTTETSTHALLSWPTLGSAWGAGGGLDVFCSCKGWQAFDVEDDEDAERFHRRHVADVKGA